MFIQLESEILINTDYIVSIVKEPHICNVIMKDGWQYQLKEKDYTRLMKLAENKQYANDEIEHNTDEAKEFRESGMLWWVNMILHTFGWAIVYEYEHGELINIYPKKVAFRGFTEELNSQGYIKVTEHINENIKRLLEEAKS